MAEAFVNLSIIPATDKADSGLIKELHGIFSAKGFDAHSHAAGINIHGEIDEIFDAVKEALAAVHARGIDRAYAVLQLESRQSGVSSLQSKLKVVA